jgi:Lar family restriction alleviation protein
MFADLLPCPFCGGKALHMTNPLGGMDFWVTCEVCSASTTVYEGKNASVSAYQAWNRRTNTMEAVQPAANNARDEIAALITELENILRRMWIKVVSALLSKECGDYRPLRKRCIQLSISFLL